MYFYPPSEINQMLCTYSIHVTIQTSSYNGGNQDKNSLFPMTIHMWPDLPLRLHKEEKPSFPLT